MQMKVGGVNASIEFTVHREGRYPVRLRDKDDHPDRDPVVYHIHLLNDELPVVRIPFPEGDVVVGEDMTVPLRVEAG